MSSSQLWKDWQVVSELYAELGIVGRSDVATTLTFVQQEFDFLAL